MQLWTCPIPVDCNQYSLQPYTRRMVMNIPCDGHKQSLIFGRAVINLHAIGQSRNENSRLKGFDNASREPLNARVRLQDCWTGFCKGHCFLHGISGHLHLAQGIKSIRSSLEGGWERSKAAQMIGLLTFR